MKMSLIRKNITLTIILSIILPIVIGQLLNSYFKITFISVPLHSVLETSGGIIAIIISMIFYMKYRNALVLTHFNWVTTALLAMGIIDIFHASVIPGELFVWLHSIAVFFGGIFFISVWFKEKKVSKQIYTLIPRIFIIFPILISLLSIIFVEHLPEMINADKTFSTTANMLNILGGIGFFIASFKFILMYIKNERIEDILFAGHAMLFGISGLLFVSSVVWDMQWWLWHILRLSAYILAFYFLYIEYKKEIEEVEYANNMLKTTTEKLRTNLTLYQGLQKIETEDEKKLLTQDNKYIKNTKSHIFQDMWQTIETLNTIIDALNQKDQKIREQLRKNAKNTK